MDSHAADDVLPLFGRRAEGGDENVTENAKSIPLIRKNWLVSGFCTCINMKL